MDNTTRGTLPPAPEKELPRTKAARWILAHKTEILAGTTVVLFFNNKSLKRENLELAAKLAEAHKLLGQGGALLKEAADYVEAKSVFDQVFGTSSLPKR